jgi:hypothetical protein
MSQEINFLAASVTGVISQVKQTRADVFKPFERTWSINTDINFRVGYLIQPFPCKEKFYARAFRFVQHP